VQSTGKTLGVTLSGALATPGLSVVSTTTLTNTNTLIHGTVAGATAAGTAMLRLNDGSQDTVLVQANGLVKATNGIQVLATTANTGDVLTVTGGLQVPLERASTTELGVWVGEGRFVCVRRMWS
jgi:hypothetical protein